MVALCVNFVGKFGISPFLTGFAKVYETYGAAGKKPLVKRSHAHYSRGLAPVAVLLQGSCQFHLLLPGNRARNIFVGRILEAESVVERHKVEDLQHTRRRHQRAVEIVGNVAHPVNGAERTPQGLLQPRLKLLVLGLEEGFGIGRNHLGVRERNVQGHQAAHFLPHGHYLFVRDAVSAELAVKPAGKGVVYLEYALRVKMPHGRLRQKAQGPQVSAPSLRVIIADKLHSMRVEHGEIQRLQEVVHKHCQNRVFLPCIGVSNCFGGYGGQGAPGLHTNLLPGRGQCNLKGLHYFSLKLRPKPPLLAILTLRVLSAERR